MTVGRVNEGAPRRDGRERLLEGAALVLGERGYEATELRDVAERGRAPRGSIYHHFPQGKAQLAAEAAARRGARIAEVLERTLAERGVLATIDAYAEHFRRAAAGDPTRLGCPVAAVALAGGDDVRLRDAAAEAFTRWERLLAAGLEREGFDAPHARAVAGLALSAVEGGLLRARAQGDLAALDDALGALRDLLAPQLAAP
jgi:AcrR family transcriptional regulator